MTTAEQYKRLTHRDHILELPDTYIGSVETHEEFCWIYDATSKKMVYRKTQFNPGFYKLFDEILVNARDALVRAQMDTKRQPVKAISIVAGKNASGIFEISVENDGEGIPVKEHSEYKVYAPELIFGHLLTSGNYNKDEEKLVGGKNGYGAKLANIFSKKFIVETRDVSTNLRYSQTWLNHMSTCGKPSIVKDKGLRGFVRITFQPDLTRFTGLNLDEMIHVLHSRAIELAALASKDVKISWNGEVIPTNTFEKFVHLFTKDSASVAYEKCSDRWEVATVLARTLYEDEESPNEKHVSFANGIRTRKGGKHVETVARHILGDFCEAAAKKKVVIKPGQIKECVLFFINSTIVNPSFDSQTKDTLTTPANKFGSQFKTSGKLVDSLMKMGLLEEAQNILDSKAVKDAKKTDGSKKKTIRGMPKLEDALWAGTANSSECTLILTEGDSAATSAITGLKVVGREKWGVFPLRGKLLNVKDISQEKFNKNEELTAIKKILGLEQGKKYKDAKSLRYGRVMVMTDQDLDGSHIKGLLMNLFHTEWIELIQNGFLYSLATPLLKATPPRKNGGGDVKAFYNQAEFDVWRSSLPVDTLKSWTLKYYKGLGTSTPAEAREWFENLHELRYMWDENSDENISLAFNKKRADDRKKWLQEYNPKRQLVPGVGGKVPYSRFIHDELIHFSNADNLRSLPHSMDGFKPSQRKILYACLKRGLKQEIRVAQLAGYVSEHAAYHHGEASLNSTITSMGQNFVGSNNIHLLTPVGQFGSRLMGGDDAASPRYIHTHLERIVDVLFRKEDEGILKYIDDDGLLVEPETYLPVLPMLLVNGCIGIGTGFSTDIPPHNPDDLVRLLRARLSGQISTFMDSTLIPWWFGFKGKVSKQDTNTYVTKGIYTMDDAKKTVTITELPVGTWTKEYKAFLDEICSGDAKGSLSDDKKPVLKGFDDLYNDLDVKFILYVENDYYEDIKADPSEFVKRFKLSNTWKTSNMNCFDTNMKIVKYESANSIFESYYGPRLSAYEERRKSEMARLERVMLECDARARFLKFVLDGTIDLRRKEDTEIVVIMKKCSLPPLSSLDTPDSVDAYEYLLRLRIDRVKASAIQEAEQSLIQARIAFERLRDTTASALWISDLDDFEKVWTKAKIEREQFLSGAGSTTMAAQKKKRQFKIVK